MTGRYEVARALAFALHDTNALVPPASIANVPVADTAALTQAYAEARMAAPPLSPPVPMNRPVPDSKQFFQVMFTDIPRRGVSQAVNSLWAPATGDPEPAAQPSGLYDLFRDINPALRKSQGGKV